MTDFYPYEDRYGEPVFRVGRRANKQFVQQSWTGDGWENGLNGAAKVPYHLPLVLACIEQGAEPIWIFEGEKDVDNAIHYYGVVATTNSGGAGKWTDAHSYFFQSAEQVNICYDLDKEGRAHAWKVHDSLQKYGVPDIRFYHARAGKDVSDHINAGYSLKDLVRSRPARQKQEVEKEHQPTSDEELLPAAFQLALLKLRELGPVNLESADEHQYNTLCPAHHDKDPSLTIRPGAADDTVAVLVHCFTGCTSDAIATALGIPASNFTRIIDGDSALTRAVDKKLLDKRANLIANQELAKENLRSEPVDWSKAKSGSDALAMPLEPVHYLVEDWFVYGTFTLLVADPKAGKTRLSMNLMQSMTENTPFLGKFQTDMAKGAKCLYLNYDMGENQFTRYLKDYTWNNADAFMVHHLLAGQFNFWETDKFDEFVKFALKNNIQTLFMDTFAVASQGYVTDENNNTEVANFCSEVRKLKAAAAIPNVFMLHHRGRSKEEHGRGASSFDASVDALWYLSMADRESHDSTRTLRAKGREVGQSPIELDYDEATESYSTDGRKANSGSGKSGADDKRLAKYSGFCRAMKAWSDENGGRWPSGKVASGSSFIPGSKDVRLAVRDEAVELGLVERFDVAGRSYKLRLTAAGIAAMNVPGQWHVEK